MKVQLLKPFCGRKKGCIVTMHPVNARKYAELGFCGPTKDSTDEEREYLKTGVLPRRKTVEVQTRADAVENTNAAPNAAPKPKRTRKPRTAVAGRCKS
jgi:hypothetical protein